MFDTVLVFRLEAFLSLIILAMFECLFSLLSILTEYKIVNIHGVLRVRACTSTSRASTLENDFDMMQTTPSLSSTDVQRSAGDSARDHETHLMRFTAR